MNNFDYEVLQKKRIAAGARHRKCGSKSKFCSLPSDNMTAAEWKRRNGKVKTYNLMAPMDWDEFKSMPHDLQQKYLDTLQTRFNVSVNRISKDLFGLCPDALRRHIDRKGLKHISMPGRGGNVPNWYVWLNDADPFEEKCDEEIEETVEKCEEEPVEETPLLRYHDIVAAHEALMERANEPVEAPDFSPIVEAAHRLGTMLYEPDENDAEAEFCISNLQTTFTGEFDPVKFMEMLSKLPIPKKHVTIRVDIEVG